MSSGIVLGRDAPPGTGSATLDFANWAGDDADDRRWYFQDYEPYRDGVRHHGGSGDRADAEFVVYPTDGDLSVCDLETVIARLGECLSRSRRGQS